MSISSVSNDLEVLANDLNEWRQSPTKKRIIPYALRQRAISLLTQYRQIDIIRALGINSTMLKQWQNAQNYDSEEGDDNETPVFIPLKPTPELHSMNIICTHRDGQSVSVDGELNMDYWKQALHWLSQSESSL